MGHLFGADATVRKALSASREAHSLGSWSWPPVHPPVPPLRGGQPAASLPETPGKWLQLPQAPSCSNTWFQ